MQNQTHRATSGGNDALFSFFSHNLPRMRFHFFQICVNDLAG
jgi:hypothetical protein